MTTKNVSSESSNLWRSIPDTLEDVSPNQIRGNSAKIHQRAQTAHARFQEFTQHSSSQTLLSLALSAGHYVHICVAEDDKLLRAACDYIEMAVRFHGAVVVKQSEIVKLSEKQLAVIDDVSDLQLRTRLAANARQIMQLAADIEPESDMVRLMRHAVASTLYRMQDSLRELLQSTNADQCKSALTELFAFLIGLTPLGPFVDGAKRSYDLFNRRTSQISAADSSICFLETFCQSARSWIATAHLVGKHLSQPAAKDVLLTTDALDQYVDRALDAHRKHNGEAR